MWWDVLSTVETVGQTTSPSLTLGLSPAHHQHITTLLSTGRETDNDLLIQESVKMMVKIVDHLVQGLAIDIEKKKHEAVARQRLETQLYRLLSEMLETERKYVSDLEQVGKIFI